MGREGFKQLVVWQRAKDLAVQVYRLSESGSISHDFSLRDQIRRSAVSVASNLAEGDERNRDLDSVRFFQIAKGSLAELRTQLQIAYEVGKLDKAVYANAERDCDHLGNMIGRLIQARLQTARRSPLAARPLKLAKKAP